MHACIIVLYNTSLRVPCSSEIIKYNICEVNLNQFSERKLLLSCMPLLETIEMVKCCDSSFLFLEAHFMNMIY
jgi:hypothetical protein